MKSSIRKKWCTPIVASVQPLLRRQPRRLRSDTRARTTCRLSLPHPLHQPGHPVLRTFIDTPRPRGWQSGRSNDSAGIYGPPDSRYIRTRRHSRTPPRLASTTLASGAGSSFFRAYTYTHWSTAKVRPKATPTFFPDSLSQPPTPTAPDATASLAPTLLASTSSAPAALR